ncbi:McrC family protein [Achromobacter aloeverae]
MEWNALSYGDAPDQIPPWAAERLVATARQSALGGTNGEKILRHGRHKLQACQVVGVVAAPGCSLEILPKIESVGGSDTESSIKSTRNALVHMLAAAWDIEVDAGSMISLEWQNEHLLEVVIRVFTVQLMDAVRRGMPRQYVARSDDLFALRGKLDVTRQYTRLASMPHKVACHYDELSPEIELNKVIKAAIVHLCHLSKSADNQRRLYELSFTYADVPTVSPRALQWHTIHLDRTNSQWRNLLNLARIFLAGQFQATSTGGQEGFALLFEMHKLFESYVARGLRRALAGTEYSVRLQGGREYCLHENATGQRVFQTRPDILIMRGNKVAQIIDTKWKRMTPVVEGPKRGVSQSDVYQMMAYAKLYQCESLTLLYPHHAELPNQPGTQADFMIAGGGKERLSLASIELQTGRSFQEALAKLIRPASL